MTTKYAFVENFVANIAKVQFEDFEEIRDRVLRSLDETEAFFKDAVEKQEKKKAFLAQLAELAKDVDLDSLTVADVEQNEFLKAIVETRPAPEGGKKRKPLVSKYKFHDADGSIRFWTGVGMQPKVVKAHIENGGSLEDFLIENYNKKHNLTATTPDEVEKSSEKSDKKK